MAGEEVGGRNATMARFAPVRRVVPKVVQVVTERRVATVVVSANARKKVQVAKRARRNGARAKRRIRRRVKRHRALRSCPLSKRAKSEAKQW